MRERLLAAVGPMLGLALFAVSVGMIHHELYAYHYHDVLEHLSAIPVERLAAAGLLTVLGYLALTGYDALAVRWIRSPLRFSRIALVSLARRRAHDRVPSARRCARGSRPSSASGARSLRRAGLLGFAHGRRPAPRSGASHARWRRGCRSRRAAPTSRPAPRRATPRRGIAAGVRRGSGRPAPGGARRIPQGPARARRPRSPAPAKGRGPRAPGLRLATPDSRMAQAVARENRNRAARDALRVCRPAPLRGLVAGRARGEELPHLGRRWRSETDRTRAIQFFDFLPGFGRVSAEARLHWDSPEILLGKKRDLVQIHPNRAQRGVRATEIGKIALATGFAVRLALPRAGVAARVSARGGGAPTAEGRTAVKMLTPLLLGFALAAPAAYAANLCPPTRLTCFLENKPVDHEAICGRELTRPRAIRLLTRQLRKSAEMIEAGNLFCGSLQALEATEFFSVLPPLEPRD